MSTITWDASADVIVVGFGAAGACTATTAADLGASVLVLEKQPAEWHTPSVKASGGMVTAVHDVEAAVPYFDRCAGGLTPLEVTRAWVERAATVVDWLQDVVGLEVVRCGIAEHPDWEGADAVSAYGSAVAFGFGKRQAEVVARLTPAQRERIAARSVGTSLGGLLLFEALEAATLSRERVTVLYEHAGARLIQDEHGRVIGVQTDTPAGTRRFRAEKGVVLTCGGYEFAEDMKINFLRAAPMYFYGSPMNTGDGVRMAQAVGADLWHMNCAVGRAIGHVEYDGKEYNFAIKVAPGGYALTDKYGRRFADEYMQATSRHDFYYELIKYDPAKEEYPRIPCYWFFDQRRMDAGPMDSASAAAGPYRYEWSKDSKDELERGWLFKAESLAEVARLAGIADPEQAARTLEEYNRGCETKSDPFGRPADSLVALDQPPYYCMPLWPGGPNTSGGPRRNERAEIVDVFGDSIQGLYSAGELGQAIGELYPSYGANLSDALCFGRIAAEQALGVDISAPA